MKKQSKLQKLVLAVALVIVSVMVFTGCISAPPQDNRVDDARVSLLWQADAALDVIEGIYDSAYAHDDGLVGLLRDMLQAQTSATAAGFSLSANSLNASQEDNDITLEDIIELGTTRGTIFSRGLDGMPVVYFMYSQVTKSILNYYGHYALAMPRVMQYDEENEDFIANFRLPFWNWVPPEVFTLAGVNNETGNVYIISEYQNDLNAGAYGIFDLMQKYTINFFNSPTDFGLVDTYEMTYEGRRTMLTFNNFDMGSQMWVNIIMRFNQDGALILQNSYLAINNRRIFFDAMTEYEREMVASFVHSQREDIITRTRQLETENAALLELLFDYDDTDGEENNNQTPTPHLVEFDFNMLDILLGR